MQKLIIILFAVLFSLGCEDIDNTIYSKEIVESPIISDDLPIPTLHGGKYIESPGYGLNWSAGYDGSLYELQESFVDSFQTASTIYRGFNRSYDVPMGNRYFRVRSIYEDYASHWSNVIKL